jgi:uncharacterized protein (DUF697 family)/uncharacterized membrane protein YebE (DUF533 family)
MFMPHELRGAGLSNSIPQEHNMTQAERESILTIALMAAFADGNNDERERGEIKRIADKLSDGTGIDVAALYQSVLMKHVTLKDAAAKLTTAESKQLAYEMAVCVCDVDNARSAAEKAFLDQVRAALGLDAAASNTFAENAAAIAAAPIAASADNAIEPKFASTMTDAEMDKMILNYAILNGALELLPQSLASMAIIPLQMKMVYRLGKVHGFDLDKSSIKDFLATLGVGLTSQYVEQFGRKLLGGLLGSLAGGIGRGIGSAATGSAFSFATTYALGQVAKRYYAGGRTINTQTLQSAFSSVLAEAKGMQSKFLPQIQDKAKTLDISQVMQMVKS